MQTIDLVLQCTACGRQQGSALGAAMYYTELEMDRQLSPSCGSYHIFLILADRCSDVRQLLEHHQHCPSRGGPGRGKCLLCMPIKVYTTERQTLMHGCRVLRPYPASEYAAMWASPAERMAATAALRAAAIRDSDRMADSTYA